MIKDLAELFTIITLNAILNIWILGYQNDPGESIILPFEQL